MSKRGSCINSYVLLKYFRGNLQKTSRWLANRDKGFLKGNPHMRLIPVQAFRFEPVSPLDGFMSLDGESVAFEPLQGRILRGKARIMSEV